MSVDSRPKPLRVGCDIGGTFTDFVLSDAVTGEITVHKRLTTPQEPSRAVLDGLAVLREQAGNRAIEAMVHATTLVVNAVIEAKGAATGLITTRGFRDILELRRHMRTHVFDIYGDPAPALVPRWHRHEVDERTFADGDVVTPLDEEQVRDAARSLVNEGVTTIAVAFLHSYANPAHERRAAELIREVSPTVEISLSSDVLPLIGEFNRTSTTVINAYVKPLVRRYLAQLAEASGQYGVERFHVMSSDGGLNAVDTLTEYPCRMIESGPVAGAIAARSVAAAAGLDHVLSFDMGGTTAKACLVKGGAVPITSDLEVARTHRFRKGSGYPVSVPSVDLIEIGAGGGSIASLNGLGLIQVGPESASAHPGPACYGLGGQRPTVTDADLVLGYLSADAFLGGQMKLDTAAAREAIRAHIAEPLGIGTEEAAWRIHDVANEMMAHAVRRHMVEKGGSDERVTLVAFGGAGPVHAYNLADKLGFGDVLVPPRAGVASAVGLLAAPVAFHLAHALKVGSADVKGGRLAREFARLEETARMHVARAMPEGDVVVRCAVDVRFAGQGFELRLDLDLDRISSISGTDIDALFFQAYEKRFGYCYDDMPVEIVNLHLEASTASPDNAVLATTTTGGAARPVHRPVWHPTARKYVEQPCYRRDQVASGTRITGPAVIEEAESTTVVGFGGSAVVDDRGSIRLRVEGSSR